MVFRIFIVLCVQGDVERREKNNHRPVLALSGPSPAALNRKRTYKKGMNAIEVALSRAGDFSWLFREYFAIIQACVRPRRKTKKLFMFSAIHVLPFIIMKQKKKNGKIQTTRMFKCSWWFFFHLMDITFLHFQSGSVGCFCGKRDSKGCRGWWRKQQQNPSQWRTEKQIPLDLDFFSFLFVLSATMFGGRKKFPSFTGKW